MYTTTVHIVQRMSTLEWSKLCMAIAALLEESYSVNEGADIHVKWDLLWSGELIQLHVLLFFWREYTFETCLKSVCVL